MTQADDSRHSLFWPGFALGVLLLATVSCGGLFAALGLNDISLSDLQVSEAVWTPPPIAPTPAETTANDQADLETALETTGIFAVGSAVRNVTNSRVNIRNTPGYLSKPDGDVLAQLEPGDRMVILDGVMVADGLNWWRIRYTGATAQPIEGWVAEATASGVTILDAVE